MTTLVTLNKTDQLWFRTLLVGILLLVISVCSSNTVLAETTICREVTSLPFVINKPGNWCLKKSMITNAATGPAIEIRKANVVLDFNGFHVSSRSGATADTTGVSIDRKGNVRIHNGTVRGFRQGIVSNRANAVIIENMKILNNSQNGISIEGGVGADVRRNIVSGTGGTTEIPEAAGIRSVGGSGVNIVDNSIENTKENSDRSSGIRTTTNAVVIQSNRITNSVEFAIFSSNNSAALVVGNNIANLTSGRIGIRLNSNNTSIYKDNLVSGFSSAFAGGRDGGGNYGL